MERARDEGQVSLVPPETTGLPWTLSLYLALICRKAQCQDTQPGSSKDGSGDLLACESSKVKVTSLKMLVRQQCPRMAQSGC